MNRQVTIIQTGTANTASVVAAFARLGYQALISREADQIEKADHLVLPGVGALQAAMQMLEQENLKQVLIERIRQDRPLLAICLGLQLLSLGSEESPNTQALGVLSSIAKRYPHDVIVPQMGWNKVQPDPGCRFVMPGYAYFANSYRLTEATAGWQVAWSDHAGRFVAACERGAVLACQFHPELSGSWGLELIRGWLQQGGLSC